LEAGGGKVVVEEEGVFTSRQDALTLSPLRLIIQFAQIFVKVFLRLQKHVIFQFVIRINVLAVFGAHTSPTQDHEEKDSEVDEDGPADRGELGVYHYSY